MIHKDDITEQDIFYYVNFPDSLPKEKREFISNNENLFRSDIEFCEESINDLPDSVNEKINATFFSDKNVTIVDLLQIDNDIEEPAREFVLAADSGVKESKINVNTFKDENNQFLLKVLCSVNKKKFFCYKPSGELLNDYFLTIFPSEDEIHLRSNSDWIEFPGDLMIEKVKIKIQS